MFHVEHSPLSEWDIYFSLELREEDRMGNPGKPTVI